MTKKLIARWGSAFDLFAMSNLRAPETGVAGIVIWVSAGEPAGAAYLGPRLWVVIGDSLHPDGLKHAVIVRLTCPPDVLGELPREFADQVASFVSTNRDVLLRHWDADIATREMLDLVVRA